MVHLLPETPLCEIPLHLLVASAVATRPILVLLEAGACRILAASGVHAIVAILRTTQLLTIPDKCGRFVPILSDFIPELVGVACCIAPCVGLVLQVAITLRMAAFPRLQAILAIVRF